MQRSRRFQGKNGAVHHRMRPVALQAAVANANADANESHVASISTCTWIVVRFHRCDSFYGACRLSLCAVLICLIVCKLLSDLLQNNLCFPQLVDSTWILYLPVAANRQHYLFRCRSDLSSGKAYLHRSAQLLSRLKGLSDSIKLRMRERSWIRPESEQDAARHGVGASAAGLYSKASHSSMLLQEAARHGVGATAVGLIFSSFSFVDFFSSLAFGRLLQRWAAAGITICAGGIYMHTGQQTIPVPEC